MKDGTLRPNKKGPNNESNSGPDGTLRPQKTNNETGPDGTLRPMLTKTPVQKRVEEPESELAKAQAEALAAARAQAQKARNKAMDDALKLAHPTFVLSGKTYTTEGVISNSTGEAEIFKLSLNNKYYALKLYYVGIEPNYDVLQILVKNTGSGVISDTLEYGKLKNEEGKERDYELMPYYSGGVISDFTFKGDEQALCRVALQAMLAINFCHEKGILHKDIKPSNFFFTDSSHDHIVLSDFGISSTFKRDSKGKVIPFKNINQNRTRIYAAPEIYNAIQIDSSRVEIEYRDEKSDFFSFGMALLTLWNGEGQFKGVDEWAMLRMKKGEGDSKLPYPEDLSENTVRLIKGLTVADPSRRWGYTEFEKWARNEYVEVYDPSAQNKDEGFKVVYSGSKNQVAHSPEELAQYMFEDTDLATQYLYSGKLSKWLEDAGFPEYQMQLDEIVNKEFPKDRLAGVLSACYQLNGDLPYRSPAGKDCFTDDEIVSEIMEAYDNGSLHLEKPNDPFYLFYKTHGMDLSANFAPQFKKSKWKAFWRLVYTIDADYPFPIYNLETEEITQCDTIDEVVEALVSQDLFEFRFEDDEDNWTPGLFTDEAFLIWLGNRDQALAGKIRTKIASESNSENQLFWYILYLLDPTLNYLGEHSQDFYTAADIALLYNRYVMDAWVKNRNEEDEPEGTTEVMEISDLNEFESSRFYFYLKAKGCYDDKIQYVKYCFDLDSKTNKKKIDNYTDYIAAFKVIYGLAGKIFYTFQTGQTVYNTEELASVSIEEQKKELEHGLLKEWLALQYHENPNTDYSKKFTYEKKLAEYVEKVGEIDPEDAILENYNTAKASIQEDVDRVNKAVKSLTIFRIVSGILILLPVLALIIGILIWGIPQPEVYKFHYPFWTLAIVGGLAGTCLFLFWWKVDSFFKGLLWGFGGVNALFFAWALIRWLVMPYAQWFIIAALLGILAWIVITCYVKLPMKIKEHDHLVNPGFEECCLEPLHYAFNDEEYFSSSIEGETDKYIDYLHDCRGKLVKRSLLALAADIIMAGIFVFTSPLTTTYFKEHYEVVVTKTNKNTGEKFGIKIKKKEAPSIGAPTEAEPIENTENSKKK